MPAADTLFCGDTLFYAAAACLKALLNKMLQSLKKFTSLPPSTKFTAHMNIPAANAEFALSVEADNSDLHKAIERITKLRKTNHPTVPTSLEQELATNPFLRANSLSIQKTLNMQGASELAVFTELRQRKNHF